MKKLIERLLWTRCLVIRTIWPYSEGYGTYRKHRFTGQRILLDSGLSKEHAQKIADEMNQT